MANCSYFIPSLRSPAHSAHRKGPTQTTKWKALQKLVLSYFYNAVHLISQLSDTEMLRLTVSESSKLLPYVMSSRKAIKVYLKACQRSFPSRGNGVGHLLTIWYRLVLIFGPAQMMVCE